MTHEQAERAILRWCRVRGHGDVKCSVPHWHGHGSTVSAIVSVRQTPATNPRASEFGDAWTVRVEALGGHDMAADLLVVVWARGVSYSEAWLLGADLARALERRDADGRRA